MDVQTIHHARKMSGNATDPGTIRNPGGMIQSRDKETEDIATRVKYMMKHYTIPEVIEAVKTFSPQVSYSFVNLKYVQKACPLSFYTYGHEILEESILNLLKPNKLSELYIIAWKYLS